jgi:AcrR family transcriptional regulator
MAYRGKGLLIQVLVSGLEPGPGQVRGSRVLEHRASVPGQDRSARGILPPEHDRAYSVLVVGKGEATRQAVLDQAVGIASQIGLAGLTIGTLASQAELSKSGLFGHFKSKEALQLQVLAYARDTFIQEVVHPALATARGEPRLRTLFEKWLVASGDSAPGCLFVSAATEFDDQPGPVRDQLVKDHQDFDEVIAQIFRTGISEGHWRPDADPEQFAQELFGIMLAHFHHVRLMRNPHANERTRRAFERLVREIRA